MTLAQLQALAAVVELGSLTAAAERLSRSQSAISHALTELEDLTEVKLLWRDRQPVVLTAAGERLWQNVVREAQLLRQQFSLSRGKLEGKLVVASLPSVSLAFVVPALEALKEMHRACRRCCSKARTAKSKGGSTTVRPMSAWWPARRRSHTLPLLDEDFVAVAADGMFAGRKSVSAKQLSTAPFIFSKAGCGPVIADYFARGAAAGRVQRGRDAHHSVDGRGRHGRVDRAAHHAHVHAVRRPRAGTVAQAASIGAVVVEYGRQRGRRRVRAARRRATREGGEGGQHAREKGPVTSGFSDEQRSWAA